MTKFKSMTNFLLEQWELSHPAGGRVSCNIQLGKSLAFISNKAKEVPCEPAIPLPGLHP